MHYGLKIAEPHKLMMTALIFIISVRLRSRSIIRDDCEDRAGRGVPLDSMKIDPTRPFLV